jgi:putative copper export protein
MAAFLIHFLSLFVLALWVGGGAAISFLVAPAVFQHAGSRRLAGQIVGHILHRFDIGVLVAGPALVLLVLLEMAGTAGGGRTLSLKLALCAAMLGLSLYSRFALTPEIRRLRDELGDQLDQLPREDRRRQAFGRLHGFSVLCLLGEILCGALAMGATVLMLTSSRQA